MNGDGTIATPPNPADDQAVTTPAPKPVKVAGVPKMQLTNKNHRDFYTKTLEDTSMPPWLTEYCKFMIDRLGGSHTDTAELDQLESMTKDTCKFFFHFIKETGVDVSDPKMRFMQAYNDFHKWVREQEGERVAKAERAKLKKEAKALPAPATV